MTKYGRYSTNVEIKSGDREFRESISLIHKTRMDK